MSGIAHRRHSFRIPSVTLSLNCVTMSTCTVPNIKFKTPVRTKAPATLTANAVLTFRGTEMLLTVIQCPLLTASFTIPHPLLPLFYLLPSQYHRVARFPRLCISSDRPATNTACSGQQRRCCAKTTMRLHHVAADGDIDAELFLSRSQRTHDGMGDTLSWLRNSHVKRSWYTVEQSSTAHKVPQTHRKEFNNDGKKQSLRDHGAMGNRLLKQAHIL